MIDLEDIVLYIAESLNAELLNKYNYFMKSLAKTYNEYIIFNQYNNRKNKLIFSNIIMKMTPFII